MLDNSVYDIYKTHLKEIFKTNRYGYGIDSWKEEIKNSSLNTQKEKDKKIWDD